MKKIITTIILLSLSFSIFSGCSTSEKNETTPVEKFLNNYTAHNVNKEYYNSLESDYHILYDIKMADANIEKVKGGKEYTFPLFISSFKTTSRMTIRTNKNSIDTIYLLLNDNVLNLFNSVYELADYFYSILTSLDPELTSTKAKDTIAELLSQPGNERYASLDDKYNLNLSISHNQYFFHISTQNK